MNPRRNLASAAAGLALLALLAPAYAQGTRYNVTNLVSDIPGLAKTTDAQLVNPWGIAFNPNKGGFDWVADNGTGVSTLYDGDGNKASLVVSIPGETPTGIVFNGSSDFVISDGQGHTGPARFIFVTESGVVAGWAPGVPPPLSTQAQVAVPSSGAVYKGLALASNGRGNLLYAADFLHNKIDVFDAQFAPVAIPGGFVDSHLPPNFSPFNITNIQGNLYVAYAERLGSDTDETAGPGLGLIDVFSANGKFIRRLATGGTLNAPWGMVLAPDGFGKFSNRLLIGNFGDGAINGFDIRKGKFKGQLAGVDRKPIHIDGLWGLAFGNGQLNQPTNVLFFAAGINDEADGLYGRIEPAEDEDEVGEDDD